MKKLLANISLFAILMAPIECSAVELGLTPSHVFGLWTNINHCLTLIATQVTKDNDWVRENADIKPNRFSGKKPSDVLERVAIVREQIDKIRSSSGLGKVETFENPDRNITPSVVFLNSGHVLDGLADWLAHEAEPGVMVTECYRPQRFNGKTPSDVFGQVDLAQRRFGLLFSEM